MYADAAKLEKLVKSKDMQKHISNLVENYKNKKVIAYGSGLLAEIVLNNYDLSGLNILAFADSKNLYLSQETFRTYKAISPDKIKDFNPDIIIIFVYNDSEILNFFKEHYPELNNIQKVHIINKSFIEKTKHFFLGCK
jgi:ABC-type Fe3+-hydroxamate transport system substrate-binding protein